MPPIGDDVPSKQAEITSWPSPSASNVWAPQYDERVEIPILERILSSPFSAAERYRSRAFAGVGRSSPPPRLPASALNRESTLSSASQGCTASAPYPRRHAK